MNINKVKRVSKLEENVHVKYIKSIPRIISWQTWSVSLKQQDEVYKGLCMEI